MEQKSNVDETKALDTKPAKQVDSVAPATQPNETLQERVKLLHKRRVKESTGIEYKQQPSENNIPVVKAEFKEKDLTANQKYEIQTSLMSSIFGIANTDFHSIALHQYINALHGVGNATHADQLNAAQAALLAMEPKDEIEAMLCSRLLVIQNHFMRYMGVAANPEQTSIGVDNNVNRATKMGRLYNETLDTLNKHRRKGEQKVVVQHVNVENGGQAIVGSNINPGVGQDGKK